MASCNNDFCYILIFESICSDFGIQILGILLRVQCKLIIVEDLLFDCTVFKKNNAITITFQILVMSDHDNGDPFLSIFRLLAVAKVVDFQDEIHDFDGGFGIEISGRLVQEDDSRRIG